LVFRLVVLVPMMVIVLVGLLAACGGDDTAPGAFTLVPTATIDPAVEAAGPQREARFQVGDELVLTMSSGDAQRQFSVTVVEVYHLADAAPPAWEYQVRWPDGLLRVQEAILSPKVK